MSLLFNMLSRLVITFLPRSKHLFILWLQSLSAVILEPRKIKSAPLSTVSSSISHEVMGPVAMILVFWMLSYLDSILKSRHITFSTRVHLVKAMVFPVVVYGCECWTIKKPEHQWFDAFLKCKIQKTKIVVSGPITSWETDGETMEMVSDFLLGGSKITADGDCSHEIKRHIPSKGKLWPT